MHVKICHKHELGKIVTYKLIEFVGAAPRLNISFIDKHCRVPKKETCTPLFIFYTYFNEV